MRLVDCFGTPCDPVYTGMVEVFHRGSWTTFCRRPRGTHAAPAICRQLGFAYGNEAHQDAFASEGFEPRRPRLSDVDHELWLRDAACLGTESNVTECRLAFRSRARSQERCRLREPRFEVTCRQFPVRQAQEGLTTAGAGASARTRNSRSCSMITTAPCVSAHSDKHDCSTLS